MLRMCVLTVFTDTDSSAAISCRDRFVELALVHAGGDVVRGRLDEAAAHLAVAETHAQTAPPDRQRRLRVAIASLKLSLATRRGHLAGVTDQARFLACPYGAPQIASASAPISACANVCTIARSRSGLAVSRFSPTRRARSILMMSAIALSVPSMSC